MPGSGLPAADISPRGRSRRVARQERRLANAPHAEPPVPQLATLAMVPPSSAEWVHEVKYDGYRILAAATGRHVRLFSRSGADWTQKLKEVADAIGKLNLHRCVLDGELVVLDEQGRSRFGLLQARLSGSAGRLVYCLFDVLEEQGRDVRPLPLLERKALLRRLVPKSSPVLRYSKHIAGEGPHVLAGACRLGLEGIVSKRIDARYVPGRGKAWIKTKCTARDEMVIAGYWPSGKTGRDFSSLLLAEYDGGKLVYRGRVGTGFDSRMSGDLIGRLRAIERPSPPLDDVPRLVRRDARWVEPLLVAEIAYTERTADGILRHPVFLGLREDKPARQVRFRRPLPKGRRMGEA